MDKDSCNRRRTEYFNNLQHPIGRPPKLTPEIIEMMADLVIQGHSIANSAKMAGFSESTAYRWLALGKKENAEPIYVELVERITEACDFSEHEALLNLRKACIDRENWRAAAWLLEHRFPEKYGRKNNIQSRPNKETEPKPDEGNSGVLVSIA